MKTSLQKCVACWFCVTLCVLHNVYSADVISNGLEEIKNYKIICDALKVKDTSGKWPEDVLPLSQMLANNSASVRREIYLAIVEHVRAKRGTVQARRELVEVLAKSLQDPSPIVRNSVAKWLTTLKPVDFGPNAKISIEKAFSKKPTKRLILLSGIVDIPAVNKKVEKLIFTPSAKVSVGRFYGTLEWAAELVRARKGNRDSIKKVLKAVEEDNNITTKVTLLLPELKYVHQPEIIIYLKKYLDSNERLEPVKPTVPGMKYAQYAAVALAQMLKGFPVIKEDLNYTEKELNTCRKWMSIQMKWTFK